MKTRLSILALLGLILLTTACAGVISTNTSAQSLAATPAAQVTPPAYAKHRTFDPMLPAASSDKVKEVTMHVQDLIGEVAPGVPMDLWTFGGSVPGPVIHVNLGDTIKFTLIND